MKSTRHHLILRKYISRAKPDRAGGDHSDPHHTLRHPSGGILNRWSSHTWEHGLQIDELEDLDSIAVRTQNSVYEITILSGHSREVIVRGGMFFTERTPVRLTGSCLGGSILKMGGIYPGFCLEFQIDTRRIVTSPVQSIAFA